MTKKATYKLALFLAILVLVLAPLISAKAQISDSYTVNGNVPSVLSCSNSSAVISKGEVLADPKNDFTLVSVNLRDNSNNPVADKNVDCLSNRGNVDAIEALSGPGQGTNSTKTNAQGQAQFRISSFTPGDALISVVADNTCSYGPFSVKFLPLPFPKRIVVVIPYPGGEIPLLVPPEEDYTRAQEEARRLVNWETKVIVPFWVFIIFLVFLILLILLVILNYLYLRRIRQLEEIELQLLNKIKKK